MRQYKTLSSDKIDVSDERFNHMGTFREALSMRFNEVPVLWEQENSYVPVIFNKDAQKGPDNINALVYGRDCSYESILSDLLNYRDHHVFDLADMIQSLEDNVPGYDKNTWSRQMKIGKDQWENVRSLTAYELSWKEYFITKNAPLKRILAFSQKDIRKLLAPLLKMNPGINLMESIAKLLQNVSNVKNTPVDNIWIYVQADRIIENKELSPAHKLQKIRELLYEMRFPLISRFRNEMNRQLQSLSSPKSIHLSVDENFETPGLQLNAQIRSKKDIDSLKKWLEEESPKLQGIIDIQRGKWNHGKNK